MSQSNQAIEYCARELAKAGQQDASTILQAIEILLNRPDADILLGRLRAEIFKLLVPPVDVEAFRKLLENALPPR